MSQKWRNGCQYQSVNFLSAVQAFSESPGCPWSVCLYGGGPSVPMQVDTLQALPAVSLHTTSLPHSSGGYPCWAPTGCWAGEDGYELPGVWEM